MIEGWLTAKEGNVLYELAKNCSVDGVIVEVGSWKGKSTICLAKGSIAGNRMKIFAVDPHTGSAEHRKHGTVNTLAEFKRNIRQAEVQHIITPLVMTSEQAAEKFPMPVGLLFVDGSHDYADVKKDFDCWISRVIPNGIVAFHDSVKWSGVRKVVDELVYNSNRFRHIRLINSMTIAEKVYGNNFCERMQNRTGLLQKKVIELVEAVALIVLNVAGVLFEALMNLVGIKAETKL